METRTVLGEGAQSFLESGLEKACFQSGKIGDQGFTDDTILTASLEAQRQLPDGVFMGQVIDKRNLHYAVAYYWQQATVSVSRLVEVEEHLRLKDAAYKDLLKAFGNRNQRLKKSRINPGILFIVTLAVGIILLGAIVKGCSY